MTDGPSVASVMADFINEAGVPYVFGYPGTSNIEFMEGARQRGVETVLARREPTAAFMAEGLSMATGGLGVCLSTLGPGSTALVNGVAAAQLDRVPMLAISGQIGTAKEPFFTHQVVEHERLFAPISKWAGRVDAGSTATIMRKALRLATAERPGAVHLTTNADVAKATTTTDDEVVLPPMEAAAVAGQVHRRPGTADPTASLREARRPVIVAGIAAVRAGATPELVRLAEEEGIPVVVAPMAKGVFPENHPMFAGVIDMACNQVIWDFLADADLVLAVGFDPVELIKPWEIDTPVVHVDAVANTDQIYRADVEVVGAIPALLDWLREEAASGPAWSEADLAPHRARLTDEYYRGRVDGRLNPTDVVDAVRAALPREAIVTTDVGSHKLLVGQGWTTYEPRTSLMSNGLSSMGFGLPAAIGAQLAVPGAPVAAIIGDGGFAMVQGELQLASSLGLGIVVVVLVDGSLNRIELKQQALGYPSTATRIEESDLVRLAEAMGCDGERTDDLATLEKALEGSAGRDRPLVIEAHIDPAQYLSQF
ncbi:thiamine pyrophosphate-binding protein [Egibacter rhizosphaerae]|uniref:Thiamine pyrophosphate-binding protein n=1 Tax=Egibacter rhizosphaerae TaxID=1670831 RepID=A0A411YH52_9ACTN|nr:thiamine pyrophosphate-binding protein [Egibacter rhizosphaerae]QBI20563.1 thiamine pyrophosphate-binding protein [Egibacter rhizosphaerae]